MDYRAKVGLRFITRRKGSLIAASLAVSIAILVVQVNSVIFQGLYNAIIRDQINYRFGHVYITRNENFITNHSKEDLAMSVLPYLKRMSKFDRSNVLKISSNGKVRLNEFGKFRRIVG